MENITRKKVCVSIIVLVIVFMIAILVIQKNITDRNIISISVSQSELPPVCAADFNGDGEIDIIDFALFANNYNKTGIDCKYDIAGGDCRLTVLDLSVFAQNYKVPRICAREEGEGEASIPINDVPNGEFPNNLPTTLAIDSTNPWGSSNFVASHVFHVSSNGKGGLLNNSLTNKPSALMDDVITSFGEGKVPTGSTNVAINFDGVDDSITLPKEQMYWPDSYSVDFWMKPDASKAGSTMEIIGNRSHRGGYSGHGLFITGTGRLAFRAESSSLKGCVEVIGHIETNFSVMDGKWRHIVATVNQSTNKTKLYVDNVLIGESDVSGIVDIGCEMEYSSIIIGYRPNTNNSKINYYKGLIDEMKIYNSEISASDVQQSYNSGNGTSTSSHSKLIAHYNFNESQGGTRQNPFSMETALQLVKKPGSLVWVAGGNYFGTYDFPHAGSPGKPIIFRSVPGQRAKHIGKINMMTPYIWLWGWELTDNINSPKANAGGGLELRSEGSRAINNYIHHIRSDTGMTAFNSGPGQVAYGNIIYRNSHEPFFSVEKNRYVHPHGIYTQNNYETSGYKYFINNLVLDHGLALNASQPEKCSGCNFVNAYGESNTAFISGLVFINNVIAMEDSNYQGGGRFLIGGFNEPSNRNSVLNNYFYRVNLQLGYRRPAQTQIKDNIIKAGQIFGLYHWGAGEVKYPNLKAEPNVITGNKIYQPLLFNSEGVGSLADHLNIKTSAYLTLDTRSDGVPNLDPTDIINNNIFSKPFRAKLEAGGQIQSNLTLQAWKNATKAKGNEYDKDSVEVDLPTQNEIFVHKNEYEPGRGNIVIYNWANKSSENVDISSVVGIGQVYYIRDPRDFWGTPVRTGNYSGGTVSVPLTNQNLNSLIISPY